MKKFIIFIIFISYLFSYSLKEFKTCKNVKNLTCINETKIFYIKKDKRVYAFAYFQNIKEDRNITFRWEKFINKRWQMISRYTLKIHKGIRWRTYAYITIRPYSYGYWRVKLIDKKNKNIIKIRYFIIEKDKKVISL